MKKFFLAILVLLVVFCACSQRTDKIPFSLPEYSEQTTDSIPEFYIYGELAPQGYLDDENPLTEKFGFKVKRVAGCEIEQDEREKILTHNHRLFDYMTEKYGEGWESNFEKETHLKLLIPLH